MSTHKVEAKWFANHHGVITFNEAKALGLTKSAIGRRASSGQWIRMHRGVYRHQASPVTWHMKARAAALATTGLVSHRAAARLWRLDGFSRARIEVVVPEGAQRRPLGFMLHQSRQFDLASAHTRTKVPVTGIDRTVLDLAAVVSEKRLGLVLDDVLRKRVTTWERITATLALHTRRGRNGCGPLRRILEDRYGCAVPDSAWNRLVGDLLQAHGLDEPAFEFEVRHRNKLLARVDLAYPLHRIAVECDSRRYHDNDASFERDRERNNRLIEAGWSTVMVTWQMFAIDPEGVVRTVRQALATRTRNSPIYTPLSGN